MLGALGMRLAMGIVALALWFARHRTGRRTLLTLTVVLVLSAALIGPWLARGWVLSGYPFFPSTFAPIDRDWRVPESIPEEARERIRGFGRLGLAWFIHRKLESDARTAPIARAMGMPRDPEAEVTGLGWVRPWLAVVVLYTPVDVAFPIALALLVAGLALARAARGQRAPHVRSYTTRL